MQLSPTNSVVSLDWDTCSRMSKMYAESHMALEMQIAVRGLRLSARMKAAASEPTLP